MGFADGSVDKESTCNAGGKGDAGLIPGLGRSPGKGNGNLFQYSCLENSMDRGAWSMGGHKESDMTEQLSTALKALWASLVAQCVKKPPAIQETGD